MSGWAVVAPEVSVVDTGGKSGPKALSATGVFATDTGARISPMTCGITYTFTAQARFVGNGGYATCGLDFFDASGQKIYVHGVDAQVTFTVQSPESTDFYLHTATKVAPAGTASGGVWCWPNSGTLMIDDVSVKGTD